MFVFLHIPKTAGTTVREVLIKHLEAERALRIDDVSRVAYAPDSWLNSHDFIAGHFGASLFKRLSADAVTYTMLRDPVARVRSQYRFLVRLAAQDIPFNGFRALLRDRSLAELLADRTDWQINSLFRDTQTWALVADYQHHYRDPHLPPERALAIAQQTLDAMTSFGIVEEMESSFRLLSDRLGWTFDARGASQVRSNRGDDDTPNADEATEAKLDAVVREHNQLDVALYDWARRLFLERCSNPRPASASGDAPWTGAPAPTGLETSSLTRNLQLRLSDAEERVRHLEDELNSRWNRMNPKRLLKPLLASWGTRRD